jgi:hypothetical protein
LSKTGGRHTDSVSFFFLFLFSLSHFFLCTSALMGRGPAALRKPGDAIQIPLFVHVSSRAGALPFDQFPPGVCLFFSVFFLVSAGCVSFCPGCVSLCVCL